ncbi:LuxR C-terminal-related transcriptional regulator [Streptomyces sp. NPDC059866]|uniref:LuxR C-terminal-related transcriptional regulator n=1 Tax=Streptomyces sp. NPDC059866 TaxID=3346978 RepID=UPI00365B1166
MTQTLASEQVTQEGLSNALKHTGDGAAVRLRIEVTDGHLEITVENPVASTPELRPGGGHGLRGIADRARLLGGTTRADADALVQAVRLVSHSDTLLFPSAVRTLAAEHARACPAPPPWAARLTGRESDVLRLMAQGLTNAEIARRMEVGPATVKSHVAALLAKTGTRDRTQAVIAAYEAGFMNAR